MIDDRLLHRLDVFLLVTAGWFLLTLVVGSFAVMALDLGTGLLALGTVVATVVVGVLSYLRTTGTDAGLRVEIR